MTKLDKLLYLGFSITMIFAISFCDIHWIKCAMLASMFYAVAKIPNE